jgi:hypothetical protein
MSLLDKIAWRLRRLRAMGAAEITYRIGQAVRARLEARGIGLARPGEPRGSAAPPWPASAPRAVDRASHLRAADTILAGRLDIFAMRDALLGFPPPWNVDPKTGTRVGDGFGKGIDYRDERNVGDIKYLWEPNRHLQLVTLAQAWHLSGERRYADGCRAWLDSWFHTCPYPQGPNWISSLEAGLRLVNWSYAWHLLGGERSPLFEGDDGQRFRARWLESVFEHCHFVAGYFSRHSSANNHLLGEYMGLFVGAVTWPLWPQSARWLQTARRGFEEEALRQTAPDGVNREQAIYYHHEVMDMMLVCGLSGRAAGIEFGAAYWQRLELMTEFVSSMLDRCGRVPMFGDSDDAQILRLSQQPDWNPYLSLLATGTVLFGRGRWKRQAGRCDDKTLWLLGDEAAGRFAAVRAADDEPPRRAFADGGYYVLGARFGQPDEVIGVVDCGPLGYLSIAAHGHADALSFVLSAGGQQLLVDPGTYAYHTGKKWRDYFRSTFAHNTVCLAQTDQSVSGGNFLWLDKAEARVRSIDLQSPIQQFEGEHDGYRHLSGGAIHRRRIVFDPRANAYTVEDIIEAGQSHPAQVCWHLSEDCQVTVEEDVIVASCNGVRLRLSSGTAASAPRLLVGQEDPVSGWVSRRFDMKVPTTTVVWEFTASRGTSRFVTDIQVEFDRPAVKPQLAALSAHG